MIVHLDAALAYACRGWPVFPVHGIVDDRCSCRRDCSSPGKHPLVRRGLHEATTDVDRIRAWWTRWPFANVALATREIAVIDIDLPRGLKSLDLIPELPRTRVSLTGGGGVHLFCSADRDLRNYAGRLPGIDGDLPGIDLRGRGGYVVTPPSLHISGNRYEWLDSSIPIASAPAWLREPDRSELTGNREPAAASPATESTAYGRAALRSEIDILLRTPVGRRNDQLNRSAFALSRLVVANLLLETELREELERAAIQIGLGSDEIRPTINSGFAVRTRVLAWQ